MKSWCNKINLSLHCTKTENIKQTKINYCLKIQKTYLRYGKHYQQRYIHTKSPVKINDQDPTDEDFEKNDDFVCGSNCVCDLCNESQLIHDSKYRHEREETHEPSELSVERRKGMCECTLIQSFDDFNSAVCLFDNSYFAQCVFFCTQSVEKCLKSLCTLLNICFKQYICYVTLRKTLSAKI